MDTLAIGAILVTLFLLQGLIGGVDTLINHEFIERLRSRPEARSEIGLHAAREMLYVSLFGAAAWLFSHGVWALYSVCSSSLGYWSISSTKGSKIAAVFCRRTNVHCIFFEKSLTRY
ncbi:MAG: hypothetical protein ABWY05_15295 [Noviherbaspirillum sp.]|jgi:hypothetical protein